MEMEEVWKDVDGWEGLYWVSNLGRVKSSKRLKSLYVSSHGYHTVGFCHNHFEKTCSVHRLVAKAFIPNPNNLPQVNHKNGIKTDNRVENLEWCDNKHNVRHSFNTGLQVAISGKNHYKSKLDDEKVRDIRTARIPVAEFARLYGVSPRTIQSAKRYRSWKQVK